MSCWTLSKPPSACTFRRIICTGTINAYRSYGASAGNCFFRVLVWIRTSENHVEKEKQKMDPREFYLIRREVIKDYYSSGNFGTTDQLDATRFNNREEAEQLGRTLSHSGVAIEIVRVQITVEELKASRLASPIGRVVD
jgi:hypothetical protein